MNCVPFLLCIVFVLLLLLKDGNCLQKRCLKCRSRGELGSCGDPFSFNATEPEAIPGIHVVACPSGWCAKIIEGSVGAYRADDYGIASQRTCLQRPPSDLEERCAYTMFNYKKVYMCFCSGDLCNAGFKISALPLPMFISLIVYYLL